MLSEKFLPCFFQKARGSSKQQINTQLPAVLVEGFYKNRLAKTAEHILKQVKSVNYSQLPSVHVDSKQDNARL